MSENRESFAQRLMSWFSVSPPSPKNDKTFVMRGRPADFAGSSQTNVEKRYEYLRTLGKGTYGSVLLAKDLKIGRLLAIKQLNASLRQDAEIYQHFLQEARIAGQLDAPNIVTIYDVEEGDPPRILMEYLGGENLERLISARAPLGEQEALTILSGILLGLSAAHAIGVVHRDVKPSNILFDQSFTPKISDFGVALMPIEVGGIDDEASRRSYVVGTPDYMAPEQLRPNAVDVDGRADLYACGLMLYEMLTGRRFQSFGSAKSRAELYVRIKGLVLPKDADFPSTVSAATKELARSLMRFNPDARPASAETARTRLETILARNLGPEARIDADREEHQTRLDMFADILRLFLVDGVISAGERNELKARSIRLGLGEVEATMIEEMVRKELSLPTVANLRSYSEMAESLLLDRDFSDADRKMLDELRQRYDISPAEGRRIEENVMIRFQMKEGNVEDIIP